MFPSYRYQINHVEKNIEDVLVQHANSMFEEELELLEIYSKDKMLFRYLLAHRVGSTKILVTKKTDQLQVKIYLTPTAFIAPFILCFLGGFLYFVADIFVYPVTIGFGIIWALVIISSFYMNDCVDIKRSLMRYFV